MELNTILISYFFREIFILLTMSCVPIRGAEEEYIIDSEEGYFTDFAPLKCHLKQNVCAIYGHKMGPQCKGRITTYELTESHVIELLHILNKMRNRVAGGISNRDDLQEVRASNMEVLSYSRQLEYTAGCWAKQCRLGHSRCRRIEDGQLGETICYGKVQDGDEVELEQNALAMFSYCINAYLHYFPRFTRKIIERLELPREGDDERNRETVQIIWGKTRYVGCYRVTYPHNEPNHVFLLQVCHYFPMGNIDNAPIFIQGEPASECFRNRSPNEVYENLCGKQRPYIDDPWIDGSRGHRNAIVYVTFLFVFHPLLV